ncbi:MAG: glutamine-hydrolyzing carbamoyl-phosphate synthase small subunit [Armatimonadota bacterium]|nr:glutamine-hydrolyzing carbamoyl-phosphate synthase small subunit [Armatimonadota bacterium]
MDKGLSSCCRGLLVLEDGSVFEGLGFGYISDVVGEVVFNTGMTGYEEVLTDPSYAGQIVVMTYPLIGNYGVTDEDFESSRIQVSGFVVGEWCLQPSNFRSKKTLDDYLRENKVPGLYEVDTRAVVRKLRVQGVMMGAIGFGKPVDELRQRLQQATRYDAVDYVQTVSTSQAYLWDGSLRIVEKVPPKKDQVRVVVADLGTKFNILRSLHRRGCQVIVVPCHWQAEQIWALEPDALLLSNGPGDPALLRYVIRMTRNLLGKLPIFGICLGHQILGWALGGRTYKLKFGHRGSNHPVKDLRTGRVYITTQNHGYSVDEQSLIGSGAEVTHINLNDGTVEGLAHQELKVLSVQYHPEASPGPLDNGYIFDEFLSLVTGRKRSEDEGEEWARTITSEK